MPRVLSPAMKAALQAGDVRPAIFVRGDFDSGVLALWTGYGQIDWNGDTYTGAGNLIGVESVEEQPRIQSTGARVTLSGIPAEALSLALQEPYQGRQVDVYLALFDASMQLIVDPSLLFSGLADVMTLVDGGDTATISLSVESRLRDLQRARIRRYEDQDQKLDYPDDRGFEFVSVIQDVNIKWGASS